MIITNWLDDHARFLLNFQHGIDIRIIQELMAHESLTSTQIYTSVSDDMQREALASFTLIKQPLRSERTRLHLAA